MTLRLRYILFLAAITAMSLWFIWPIYQDVYLFVTALGALVAGLSIGLFAERRKTSILTIIFLTLTAFLVLSLPLSNPRALSDPEALLSGYLESIVGPVEAWKQIITIELPVGTYQALLSPVFVLFLLMGVLFGTMLFANMSRYWLASIPVIALVVFAISFGVSSVPGEFAILGISFPVDTPIVTGGALFVLLVVYLNWGARATRREKLLVRKESLGFTANLLVRKLRRFASATGVLVLALIVTGTSMQFFGVSTSRTVLRTGVEKVRELQQQTSPLSTYRMYFTNSELLERNLLSYTVEGSPERIRIATMPYYNGDTFTVAPTDPNYVDENSMFSRVPSDIATRATGEPTSFELEIGELNAIWLPTVAGVTRVSFLGQNSSSLSDSLFLNRATETAAIIPGQSNGARYRIDYRSGTEIVASEITKSASSIKEELMPESLKLWLETQTDLQFNTGEDLQLVAKRLQARGFLSHGLEDPNKGDAQTVNWITALEADNYQFAVSTAGHNRSRLETFFKELIDQQEGYPIRTNVVSTAGDDEQFAAAMALIASAKGFPARVVIGFRTSKATEVPGVPACAETGDTGVCVGKNLTAWAEVKGSNGDWLPLDVTPQFEKPLKAISKPTGTPKNPTSSGENAAGVLPPAKAIPSSDSECLKNPNAPGCEKPQDEFLNQAWAWIVTYIWPVIQVLLILTIVAGPFLVILLMKRRRRKTRRDNSSEFARVVGAWEEYLDISVDYGAPIPKNKTRIEIARESASPDVLELAEMANLMAYGSSEVTSVEITDSEVASAADRSWEIFDAQRAIITGETKGIKQLLALISLRSFIRVLKPKEELKRLTSAIRFNKGNKVSEGSGAAALFQAMKSQTLGLFSKK